MCVLILCYNNLIYADAEETGANTPKLREAFGRYVSFLVSTFKGKVYAWEIWNEPDQKGFWRPVPKSSDYCLLVKHVAPIIRKIDPHALIIAGATVGPNWEYLDSLRQSEAWADIDVISFHWYTYTKPPDSGPWNMSLHSVQSFVQAIRHLGKRVWITEMGYSTSNDKHGISEIQQTEYLRKQLELAAEMGVEICFIYDLIDDGPDAGNKLHRFGLFRSDGTPKPAAAVLAPFNSQIRTAK